jgi:hypothetical protein
MAAETVVEVGEAPLIEMLQYIRTQPNGGQHLELELRIGQFQPKTDGFVAGYAEKHKSVINRLLTRLRENATQDPLRWVAMPQVTMVRAHYDDSMRKTCCPDLQKTEYQLKRPLSSIMMESLNREYDVRINLSLDTLIDGNKGENKALLQRINTSKPRGVRYIQRASFMFTEPRLLLGENQSPFRLQFDISKASAVAADKKQATQQETRYHCEVELATRLASLDNAEQEQEENRIMARHILAAGKALLGSSLLGSTSLNSSLHGVPRQSDTDVRHSVAPPTFQALPDPILRIVKEIQYGNR